VTVENLGPCKKLVRFEVDAATVDEKFESTTMEIQRRANLPGFRRGKAPRHLVVRTYGREIEEEVKRQLISESYKKGIEQEKLHPIAYPDIEEIQFGKGQALQFAATIETAPEFELPEYKGLTAQRELAMVTDEDVERALDVLREKRAVYTDVARAVQEGDYVVVDYSGACEDKPITELAPTARGLAEKKGFWLHVAKDSFIPGFTEQLVGAQAGEKRTVNVDFPPDFVTPALAGKRGVYQVDVVQVKEKALPEMDESFATAFGAESVEKLRLGVRNDLQNELSYKQKRAVRDQLIGTLLSRITCELPESIVTSETKNVVYDIVRDNTQRGLSKEVIDRQKDQIFAFANQNAKDRVKSAFVLARIAEKEGIKVDEKEITQRILMLADQYQIRPEKLVKQLQERNGIAEIRDQIMTSKVLDFLELHAKIEEVLPTASPR
jgi:trigger factor